MSVRRILLIEDDITLGDLIVLVLTKRDYQVTWYVRARLEADSLIFMTDRGVEHNFDDCNNKNSPSYDLAFVDSRLKRSDMQGWEVTRELTKRGVKVIASSGLMSLNEKLIQAGAVGAISKDEIFGRAFEGKPLLPCPQGPIDNKSA